MHLLALALLLPPCTLDSSRLSSSTIGDSPERVRLDVLGNPVGEWREGGNEDHWMSLPVGRRSRLSVTTSQLVFFVGAVVSS